MSWQDLAKDLPVGAKTRTDCPSCGEGKTLIINHLTRAYTCMCFRCDYKGYSDKGTLTLDELKKIADQNELAEQFIPLELPEDFTEDIPLEGRLWLYYGGVTPTLWKKYKIGYSAEWNRVVIPVYNDAGVLVWFQARALNKQQKPKYMQPSREREAVVFKSISLEVEGTEIVVVEDMLSAIRVGEVTNAWSILGTKLTSNQAVQLMNFDLITVWLDNDAAGKLGAYSIRKTLGLVKDVRNVVTKDDPKRLTRAQIKEVLWDKNK